MDEQSDGVATQRVVDLPLPALPRAAGLARRALRDLLEGTAYEERCEDASLALSEVVTNAVLHGREPLSLRAELDDDRLRLEVRDGSPLGPTFSVLDTTAVTGRGLLLVTTLADRWGLEPCPDGKAVWFELDRESVPAQELGVDELLASWGEDVDDPAQEVVKVVLTDLDVSLTARSEAHVEALLRELALVAGGPGVDPDGDGKAVWFELDLEPEPSAPLDVDELLASWGEDVDDPAQEVVKVVLTELDVAMTARSESHVEGLLRELALVAGCEDDDPRVTLVAERVLSAAAQVELLRSEVKAQLSRAVLAGEERLDVVLRITRIDAETVREFARAISEADRLSRRGELLTQPAPRELSAARERYLSRIISQLSV